MKTRTTILAALAVLVLAGCGGDEEASPPPTTTMTQTTDTTSMTTTQDTATTTEPEPKPPAPTVVRVRVVNGAPQGGIVRKTVKKGNRVVLVVNADVTDHVHLHGYDLMRDVTPGKTARIQFRATVPGRFEVELEDRSIQIADLTVEP